MLSPAISATAPATPLAYRPELTGLRALAVVVVVGQHWFRPPFMLGEMGRCLFFVMSGYLVSGIAWKYGAYAGAPGPWGKQLRVFYARRVLRILPPYYLALLGCALLPLTDLWQHPAWFLLPGANLFIYWHHGWPDGLGHYWTLAVDEQFYLLWPFALGLLGRRVGPLLAVVAGSWAFRLVWGHYGSSPGLTHLLLPASFDLFAWGAILRQTQNQPALRKLAQGRWVALGWAVWVGLTLGLERSPWADVWEHTYVGVVAMLAFLTVAWLLHDARAVHRLGLAHPAMQWLGVRSYGIYLYHLPLLVVWQRLVHHFVPVAASRARWLEPLPTLLVLTPLLLLACAASWRFVEEPLDRLKRHFRYAGR